MVPPGMLSVSGREQRNPRECEVKVEASGASTAKMGFVGAWGKRLEL
jgi:hypothetical protein